MGNKKRGILYIYWGDKLDKEVNKSIESIKFTGLPYHVQKFNKGDKSTKTLMYDLSPFEETLFLDTDTMVLDNIDYGFKMAQRHGVAITIAPACYARRFTDNLPENDLIEYNSGVIFFKKNNEVEKIFN